MFVVFYLLKKNNIRRIKNKNNYRVWGYIICRDSTRKQAPVLWVEHNDKGRVELNYLTFNSLQDKRSYTVYLDKRDRGLVNDYSEIINYENNLSSPFEEKENKNTLVNTPKPIYQKTKKEFVEN